MAACWVHCSLLLLLLAFTPYSGTLKCHNGTIVKFGSGLTDQVFDWSTENTIEAEPNGICQETFLIVDVGPKSLLVGSKGSGLHNGWQENQVNNYAQRPGILAAMFTNFCEQSECNNATSDEVLVTHLRLPPSFDTSSIKCSVCLTDESFCPMNLVFCPKNTACYSSDITIKGGGVDKIFRVEGCLDATAQNIFKGEEKLGVFSVSEKRRPLTADSFSLLFAPGTSLAWVLGLGLFLTLYLTGFIISDEAISL
ncbi:CD177 antigen-like [Mesocricetus auratus]|uniref:CD177 antigen-like n=1 Tax=Mesocricetus auratus TaxID=10036 RepID=A0ABM2WMZ7_MESAU|nr:CD177 antigen-like [Mesocricetus auratus]XP_040590591.1 CD177 antigen-like [Mesocricetus auratus]